MTRRREPVLLGDPGSAEQLAQVSTLMVLALGGLGCLGLVATGIVMGSDRIPPGYHPLALAVLSAATVATAGIGWRRRALFSPGAVPYVLVVGAVAVAVAALLSGPTFASLATMCLVWYGSTITYLPRRVAVGLMGWAALVDGVILVLQRGNTNPLARWEVTAGMMAITAWQWNFLVERSWALARGEQAARADAERARSELEFVSGQKTRFLARMSHELRTPLNAIIGFSEVLARRSFGSLNAKQAEYVEDIVESGQHLLALVDDLLDLTKIETGAVEPNAAPVDLAELLAGTAALFKEQTARRRITLTLHVADGLPTLEADARQLKQVVFNLLANAVRFTPAGGTIVLAAHEDGPRVLTSVSDTGPGVAPEDREAIFEEFRQGSPTGGTKGGTGLGLPLARRLVEAHGGRLEVASRPDEGSTFTVSLPIRPRPPGNDQRPPPAADRRRRLVLGQPDSTEGRVESAHLYFMAGLLMVSLGVIFTVTLHLHRVPGAAFKETPIALILLGSAPTMVFLKVWPRWLGAPSVLPYLNGFSILYLSVTLFWAGPVFGGYVFLIFVAPVGTLLLLTPRQRIPLLLLLATAYGVILGFQDGHPVPVARFVVGIGFLVLTVLVFGRFVARIEAQAHAERVARGEAERVKAELERTSRHKIEFLAHMSHELRTPLNVIIGFSEVLAGEAFGPLNHKQTEYVGDVLSSGRHLLTLINDILDLAKIDAGRMDLWVVELDLESVVDGALQRFRAEAARRRIELSAETAAATPVTIEADEAKLVQIIGHLISNALKFSPDGGRITLRTAQDADHVQIFVADTGRGIEAADHQRIFDAFALGDPQTDKGTGLGLALARRYAELHHGTLDVTSQSGMGATFTLRLPRRAERVAAEPAPAEVA
jgi:signal transduction histidine kinase